MAGSESPQARVSNRVGAITESMTLAIDAKAKALKAAGRPVIVFGAGEPDFPTPDYIVKAAAEACFNTANHRYTPSGGLPELRKAITGARLPAAVLRAERRRLGRRSQPDPAPAG